MAETITLDHLSPEGFTVGTLSSGRKIGVWGALPGEKVSWLPLKRKGGMTLGIVQEILEPSEKRCLPQETHFLSCSPWQILNPNDELAIKKELIARAFETLEINLPSFEIRTLPTLVGYRNKMEFSFVDTDDGVSLAFFERSSRNKTPLDSCCLASPSINAAAAALVQHLRSLGIQSMQLKSLVLRSNLKGEAVAALFVTDPAIRLPSFQEIHPLLIGALTIYSDPQSPASRVTEILNHDGTDLLAEQVLGKTFTYPHTAFFQVNVPCFELALEKIKLAIDPRRPVIDMFGGVGTIGISLGAPHTTIIESDESATRFAKVNAVENNVTASVIHSPAEKTIEAVQSEASIIVDPPRVGLHPKVIKALRDKRPKTIIYLSCNYVTQANDLQQLLAVGYTLDFFEAYNFFPRTPHVETLAILKC